MKIRLPKKRRYRVLIYIVCAVLVLYAIDLSWIRLWRHITVARDTTFITTPVRQDGMPDYARYLNARMQVGVTPANNAAIPYVEAFDVIAPGAADETYRQLGVPRPRGDRPKWEFSLEDVLAKRHPAAPGEDAYELGKKQQAEADFVRLHPWSAAEHPDAAAWVRENEASLNVLHAMADRSQWYVPLVPTLDTAVNPAFGVSRALTNLAQTRAMLSIQEGRFADAEADLLACHKMARVHAQSWSLIQALAGLGIEKQTLLADAAILPYLTAAQLKQFRVDLDALPAWPPLSSAMEGERCRVINRFIYTMRNPISVDQNGQDYDSLVYFPDPDANFLENGFSRFVQHHRPAHANAALRLINTLLDKDGTIATAATVLQREDLLKVQEAELRRLDLGTQGMLADPGIRYAVELLNWGRAFVLFDNRMEQASLLRVALALSEFHAANGQYPGDLVALTPGTLTDVPMDLFTEKPLYYRKTVDGCVVYSVGYNLKDDAGWERGASHLRADDIVIRLESAAPAASKP